MEEIKRCAWGQPEGKPLCVYHDTEWGVPIVEDAKMYEMFLLETFQAGLAWAIILNKREGFRRAFDNFDPVKIASYGEEKIASLLNDPAIIRSKAKIRAAITNAQIVLKIREEFGSFCTYLWGFTQGKVITNQAPFPKTSALSDRISQDLSRRGMKYVGSVTIYSFLEAVGIVNDHEEDCFRFSQIQKMQDAYLSSRK